VLLFDVSVQGWVGQVAFLAPADESAADVVIFRSSLVSELLEVG